MWFVFAILSAVVVVVMAWGMVFLTHTQSGIAEISKKVGYF